MMHAGRGVLKSCHTLASWRKNGILDLIRKTFCFSFHCKLDNLLRQKLVSSLRIHIGLLRRLVNSVLVPHFGEFSYLPSHEAGRSRQPGLALTLSSNAATPSPCEEGAIQLVSNSDDQTHQYPSTSTYLLWMINKEPR
ncbi:hypothetical protein HZ326_15005 [Fusarium oxysporum f. sp. albedinis]|nr:hypothetical protein HZ326_15005 [Fusarium oxysporum f. sp. albedinis]